MQSVGNGSNRTLVYDGKIAGLYDLEETLGSGHFAVVKLARHVFTGEKVAVKVIDKTKLDEVSRAHLFQEVRCMKLVQHPNVVRLYEVIDTQTKLYLILELGDGGDLYDYIMKHEGGLSENLAREYFRQIVRAISYCHQLHVVHRDLKPENVVFFEKLGVVKLTDFGFSNRFYPGQKLETSCGSLAYSAPEILLGDSYDAPAVDIWSLGVILYMLVCGNPPFEKANDSETLTMIMDCKYTMPPHVSQGCRDLIGSMLVREPEKRATLQNISQNSWLTQGAKDTVPEYLPLVSRQQVSDEDHALIIQKIVNGNIATKEEILDALDRNEYNHITATYFLLAERKLRQQRQDHMLKRRPELSLPVSCTSRLLTRTRNTICKSDQDSSGDFSHHLAVPSSNQLAPRTPGAVSTASGRSRKCSIVQEEDDEDEIPTTNRDELQTPLNRRGSRSEGRINIAVQDRMPESERLKKENPNAVPTKNILEATTTIAHSCPGKLKLVNKDVNRIRRRLGGLTGVFSKPLLDQNNYTEQLLNSNDSSRSNNRKLSDIDRKLGSLDEKDTETAKMEHADVTQTKFLVDSSTITIPINSATLQISSCINSIQKYNTMPSTIKPVAITMGGASALKEIFEECTDIGSSDSAATTPRPIIHGRNFTINRANQNTPSTQRRSKFPKSRTPSCSSSEASDDDSESRKKRAHKINLEGASKPIHTQRRDSHDDSSDSQDQGTTTASGGTTSSTLYLPPSSTTSTGDSTQTSTNEHQRSSSTKKERQTTDQAAIVFRRHRTGRRRAGETRLRESQSLNRIAEVQESDLPPIMSSTGNQVHGGSITFRNNNIRSNKRIQNSVKNNLNCTQKPKGISARLFQGFIKKTEVIQAPINAETESPKPSADLTSNEDVDMVFGIDFAKPTLQTKCSSATKKLKMLGRYFQVHKKICIPLPGLFQRGRLYKAQSCGSIVRDKVNHNIHNNAASNTTRHSVLCNEKGKLLRNCLGSKFLGNSDSDINQNNEKSATHNKLSTSLLFHIPSAKTSALGSSEKCKSHITSSAVLSTPSPAIPAQNLSIATKNSTSSPHQLNDVSLCSSKC